MNRPTPSERRAMRNLYAAPKPPIIKWVVIHCGKQVYEGTAGLCEEYIKVNRLVNAYKKAVR